MDWISPLKWPRRGAAAILWEPDERALSRRSCTPTSCVTPVPDLSARASLLADRFFASPSRQLDVIGVTGTNGKTTCAWLLAQALTACGQPAAYLGTLGTMFAGQVATGDLTTPDAVTVQRQLAAFARAAPGRWRWKSRRTPWSSTALRPCTSMRPCSPT